ncbi:hypothetical protein Q73A0000_01160 [Kaistella flava (ex Peng et al. 2021)]|uniref:Uncharacterized protein n=1 Tax=Kaistella flava (ex Peng et al. 2021) TaxID=2038776 RepID=A0A7M2Y6J6_9FLAO|nr:hypothetical protein [Kaistella flava (ex Peng et al. 2021)]QOW09052.1 hypothetical protein Q73A0000_01160 [Kaistella flava (ex Peng et al. 2021)]
MRLNKRYFLFTFLLFFTALCAGMQAHHNDNVQSFSENISRNSTVQNLDYQSPTGFYVQENTTDDSDSDCEELEIAKFGFSAIIQKYKDSFLRIYFCNTQPIAVHNHNYTAMPRYILYHALKIAG